MLSSLSSRLDNYKSWNSFFFYIQNKILLRLSNFCANPDLNALCCFYYCEYKPIIAWQRTRAISSLPLRHWKHTHTRTHLNWLCAFCIRALCPIVARTNAHTHTHTQRTTLNYLASKVKLCGFRVDTHTHTHTERHTHRHTGDLERDLEMQTLRVECSWILL